MYHIRRLCLYVAIGGRKQSTTLYHKAFERPLLTLAERRLLWNTLHLCAVHRRAADVWLQHTLSIRPCPGGSSDCVHHLSDAAPQVRVPATPPFTSFFSLFPLLPSQCHMAPLPLIFIPEDMYKKKRNKEVQGTDSCLVFLHLNSKQTFLKCRGKWEKVPQVPPL